VPLLKESIEVLSRAAEFANCEPRGMAISWPATAEIIAKALHFHRGTSDLVYAARIHDVGKIFVPERILNKPGRSLMTSFFLVRMHARVGARSQRSCRTAA